MVVAKKKKPARGEKASAGRLKVGRYVLDEAREQALWARANALDAAAVARVPSYVAERLSWMEALHARAARDVAELVEVPLDDDSQLSRDEIDAFGYEIALARKACGARTAATSGGEGDADDDGETTATLRPKIRRAQRRVLKAFDLRFRNDPEGKALLQKIREGNDDHDMLQDTPRILALCEDKKHRAWFARLPKGEPQVARDLATWTARFVQLRKASADATGERMWRDLASRAWSLAARTADRVQAAGAYVTSDDPARRGDYRKFRQPKGRKARAKKPAAPAQ